MKVVYFSFSGNVRRFIQRAGIDDTMEITQDNCTESVSEPYILVTGTIGFGSATTRSIFLEVNHAQLQSGSCKWKSQLGTKFCESRPHNLRGIYVPLLMKFEVQGTNNDVIEFKDKVGNFNENHGREEIQSY